MNLMEIFWIVYGYFEKALRETPLYVRSLFVGCVKFLADGDGKMLELLNCLDLCFQYFSAWIE